MSRWSTLRGNLLALALGCTASVALAEVALRIHNPIPIPVRGQKLVLPPNADRTGPPPFANSKFDPTIRYTTNRLGFRGPQPPADPSKVVSVIAVGGSTTECKLTSDDKTWTALLAGRLARVAPDVWLNNAGLDGNSTFGHLMLLDQVVLALKPRYILFLIGMNDVGRADGNEFDGDTKLALRRMLYEKSELLGTLHAFWRSYRAAELGLGHMKALDLTTAPRVEITDEALAAAVQRHDQQYLPGFERRVRALVDRARAAGSEPILITQPALYGDFVDPTSGVAVGTLAADGNWTESPSGDNARARWVLLERYNDVTRRVGQELGVQVIELGRAMPKDWALYYDWMHFSNEGNAKIAEIVAEALAPRLAAR